MNVYMFHYVHKKDNGYKYFEYEKFERFIEFIKKEKNVLSLDEFYEKYKNNSLSEKDILLTFDDGTIDHYKNVYEVLKKNNISGTFFICKDTFDNKGLLPNKIHMLLANVNFDTLYSQFYKLYEQEVNKGNIVLKPEKESKFDKNNEVRFLKQSLQYRLPKDISNYIIDELYRINDLTFDCSKYYISLMQAKEMKENGMCFGAHTKSHPHLEYLDYNQQKEEIVSSIKFINDNNLVGKVLSFAYPYGSHNGDTLKILKSEDVDIAFLADDIINKNINCYAIPRIDCKVIDI